MGISVISLGPYWVHRPGSEVPYKPAQSEANGDQALLAEYRGRSYAERRQTKEWAILKKQVHQRDGYRCRLCGRDDVELHVHHCTYENYAQERLEDLITLCAVCHHKAHFDSEAS